MKNLKNLLLLAVFAAIVASCGEAENNGFETQVGTATINGLVKFDNDDVTDPQPDSVTKAGLKVLITYQSDDLSLTDVNGVVVTKVIEATTDADGKFSVEVPAVSKSVTYDIEVIAFVDEFTQAVDASASTVVPETVNVVYGPVKSDVSLFQGGVEYIVLIPTKGSEF